MNGDDKNPDALDADANADARRAGTDARRTEDRHPRRARPDAGREWELFVREEAAEPLRHVGSVSGRTAAVARERAESLFGWAAEGMWLCPADEVRRVGGRPLDGEECADDGADATRADGGDPTGERVADVDYCGNVHPTQFWQGYSLGNVRDRPFGAIWEDESNPLLTALREREGHLTGRCADCRYRDICRGASRLRVLSTGGGVFAPDPQCYLTESERLGTDSADPSGTGTAAD